MGFQNIKGNKGTFGLQAQVWILLLQIKQEGDGEGHIIGLQLYGRDTYFFS